VNEFVDECRREWKRLGVPDPVANEMAADLAADLEEAEAEGASPEDVLGSGAFDPRSFASAWAVERGLIGRRLSGEHGRTRGSRLAAAIGTVALVIAIAGAVLLIDDSRSDAKRLAFLSPVDLPPDSVLVAPTAVPRAAIPPPPSRVAEDGITRVVMLDLPVTDVRFVAVEPEDGIDGRAIGSILLIVGLAGAVASTLFVLWRGPGRGRAAVRTTTTV
jgi:hypothetical protein